MTVQQIETVLFQLPIAERLRLAHLLLSSIVETESFGKLGLGKVEDGFEYVVDTSEWMTLSEPSLEFWNNEEDARYDEL